MDIIKDNNISILINHKPNLYNDKNWICIRKRYETLMPNAQICFGSYTKKDYSKSLAINNASKAATGDTFIISDSNIAFNIDCIKKGLDIVKQSPLVIPYGNLIHLNQRSTDLFHRLSPSETIDNTLFRRYKRKGNAIGYIFIVQRSCFEAIGGFNESITEWDEENLDFINRLCSKFGDFERLTSYPIWSLFYEKIYYPEYVKGINVEEIFKRK